jgi:hypothetical protein
MDSLQEVRSKDTGAWTIRHSRLPRSSFGHAALQYQRTLGIRKPSICGGCRSSLFHSSPCSAPQNHPHRSRIRTRPPRSGGRFDDHNPSDSVSQLTRDQVLHSADRSGDHCRRFGSASRHQSKRFPKLDLDSLLTEETSEVFYRLHNLHSLWVGIERGDSLPSTLLPNLTELTTGCDNEDGWRQLFDRATFGKLESVAFYLGSKQIGDLPGTFERSALSSSLRSALSKLCQRWWEFVSEHAVAQRGMLHRDCSCGNGS